MFGSHLSIAGSMVNALIEAQQMNLDCVQVFTKNQRQWSAPPLTDEVCSDWLGKLKELNWHKRTGPDRVVSHNSYLINLASPNKELRDKSIALQREELDRCERLRIPLCVSHPGAHMGKARPKGEKHVLDSNFSKDELAGLKRIVKCLDKLHKDLPGYRTITCLETTVGAGTTLGYSFDQLAFIRSSVREPKRIAFCLDTCHVTAAGYDMTTDAKAANVLDLWDEICGFKSLKALHFNDSIGEVGSRKDRHAHIGEGECGLSCFRAILNHPQLAIVPKILETPKGMDEKEELWDVRNIRRLKRLVSRKKAK